jgi:hypothetical protein
MGKFPYFRLKREARALAVKKYQPKSRIALARSGAAALQSEKFLLVQSENFLLTTGKITGWKRRVCC